MVFLEDSTLDDRADDTHDVGASLHWYSDTLMNCSDFARDCAVKMEAGNDLTEEELTDLAIAFDFLEAVDEPMQRILVSGRLTVPHKLTGIRR